MLFLLKQWKHNTNTLSLLFSELHVLWKDHGLRQSTNATIDGVQHADMPFRQLDDIDDADKLMQGAISDRSLSTHIPWRNKQIGA